MGDAGLIADTHQFGQRVRLHLFHHAGPVDFDSLFRRARLTSHLLVQSAFDDQREHFPLALREAVNAAVDGFDLDAARACLRRAPQRGFDRAQQIAVAHRLDQEVRRARLHCAHAGRDIAVPGEEDDRQRPACSIELTLQLQSVQVGELHVEQQAGVAVVGRAAVEELARCAESFDKVACAADQAH